MHFTGIKETCIYIADVARARQFYEGQLGLDVIVALEGRHLFLRVGNAVLLCFVAAHSSKQTELPPHGASGVVHFAFEVQREHYATTRQEVLAAGIEILYEHQWANGPQSFYFNDPDGNLLEVVQQGLWD